MATEDGLKSRMRENRKSGSVRGSDISSHWIKRNTMKGVSSCLLDGERMSQTEQKQLPKEENYNIMTVPGKVLESAKKIMPEELQKELMDQIRTEDQVEAAPAGAILMGVYVLDYLGFARYIDDLTGEEHTSLAQLREHYLNKSVLARPLVPSTGIILSLLAADMIACPRHITPAYKFVEMAKEWQTGPLLGIEPALLNDDRIGRALSLVGKNHKSLEEVLINLVMNAGKQAGIPLNKFILDTTNLQLDGAFKDADKVEPGRGKNSFSQLIVSLVIAADSRMPVGFGVLAGSTSDSKTLPGIYETVHQVADPGAVEFLMDRIYPTPRNILFLKEKEQERQVYWISPLKMGLSEKRVREQIDLANKEKLWQPISYRSSKEIKAQTTSPMEAFETTWVLTETIKPDLEEGQSRRPRGSIQKIDVEVRCVFYRHELKAENEAERRRQKIDELEHALTQFRGCLNKRKYRKQDYCQNKLAELLNNYGTVSNFVDCTLVQTEDGIITLNWTQDEKAIREEERYDGIFALLTNYAKQQVNHNQLVTRYRSRDEVEVNFKAMRGLLDLERVLFSRPERIDAYIFLKVIALFVLTFLRSHAEREGVKTTEKQIQESMGDLLLVKTRILPLGLKTYAVARDSDLNRLFRKLFYLPEPTDLIKALGRMEIAHLDEYVQNWYEKQLETSSGSQ